MESNWQLYVFLGMQVMGLIGYLFSDRGKSAKFFMGLLSVLCTAFFVIQLNSEQDEKSAKDERQSDRDLRDSIFQAAVRSKLDTIGHRKEPDTFIVNKPVYRITNHTPIPEEHPIIELLPVDGHSYGPFLTVKEDRYEMEVHYSTIDKIHARDLTWRNTILMGGLVDTSIVAKKGQKPPWEKLEDVVSNDKIYQLGFTLYKRYIQGANPDSIFIALEFKYKNLDGEPQPVWRRIFHVHPKYNGRALPMPDGEYYKVLNRYMDKLQ